MSKSLLETIKNLSNVSRVYIRHYRYANPVTKHEIKFHVNGFESSGISASCYKRHDDIEVVVPSGTAKTEFFYPLRYGGFTTVSVVLKNGKVFKTTSVCSKKDAFNRKKGVEEALLKLSLEELTKC